MYPVLVIGYTRSTINRAESPTEETIMTKTCTIEMEGSSSFYISYKDRGTRSVRTFKTPAGAQKSAEGQGYTVTKVVNPKAKSCAHRVTVTPIAGSAKPLLALLEAETVSIEAVNIENFNTVLERLGYKPVKLTRNILNAQSPTFAIDQDTPVYMDPGCESYHSM